ncbi:MAG TPA: GerMN domain-containing protein [Thermoanaerobaculia bacterium]
MSRRVAAMIVLGAVALAGVLALVWLLWRDGGGPGLGGPDEEEAESRPATFELYFPGEGGYLHAEERELAVTGEARQRARAIVLAVLDGPGEEGRAQGLERPFPEDVGLLDLYLTPDGTAFVDLGAPERETPPAGGSLAEMMMVYSVVDSLVLNLPEVERVALLWNGVQRESFSGHLDTSVPLEAEEELLAASVRERRRAEG